MEDLISIGGCAAPDGITFYGNGYKVSVSCKKPKNIIDYNCTIKVEEQSKTFKPVNSIFGKIPVLREIKNCFNNRMISPAILILGFLDIVDYFSGFISKPDKYDLLNVLLAIIFFLTIVMIHIVLRSFRWHGAEHKAINTYKSGKELTLSNVKTASRIAKRCGTNLLAYVIILNLLFQKIVDILGIAQINSIIFVFSMSMAIEMMNSKWLSQTHLYKALEWLQSQIQYYITTKEPDDWQISCAIKGIQVLIDKEKG